MGYRTTKDDEITHVVTIYQQTKELLLTLNSLDEYTKYTKSDASYELLNYDFKKSIEMLHAKASMILAFNKINPP